MSDAERREQQTFDPTPRQREEFRKQGRVFLSHDLTTGLVLLATSLLLWHAGPEAVRPLASLTRTTIVYIHEFSQDSLPLTSLLGTSLLTTGKVILFVVPVIVALGSLTSLIQTGFNVSFHPLQIDWSRLSWSKGWERLWSRKSAVRAAFATVKLVLLAGVTWWVLEQDWHSVPRTDSLLARVWAGWQLSYRAATVMSLVLIALGVLDFLFQRSEHENQLRMTRKQLQDEQKEEGVDPQIRARIRKLQRERAKGKMLADVPKAHVIVTNPTHYAIAIRYDRATMAAPKVVAKGKDVLAQKIVEIARQHDIPIVERKQVARLLYRSVEIGHEVPTSLYHALAEILNYIYRLRHGT